jgi:hypothetical protein
MSMLTREEMEELANDIEESEGIALLKPVGPIQVGFRRSAAIVDILRRLVADLPVVPRE